MNVCGVGELQAMCEALLYASHSDPQMRGNTALVIGRLLRAGLGEGRGSWDSWLAVLHPAAVCSMSITSDTALYHVFILHKLRWQFLCPLLRRT